MIKGIIFDWFGVCTEKWIDVWQRDLEGKVDEESLRTSFFKYLNQYASASISGEQFLQKIFGDLNQDYSPYKHLLTEPGKINEDLLSEIKTLKRNYKIALLSDNFNEMIPVIERDVCGLRNYFDVLALSNELGMSKSNENIYQETLNRLKLPGNECIFIDDKEKNLILARKQGINTILYENNKQLNKELKKYEIK